MTRKTSPELLRKFHGGYVPDPNSGCWLWIKCWTKAGYGQIVVGRRKTERAHRFSYEAFVGPLEPGDNVLHKCDTPCCVNPDHLKVGSIHDNHRDMAKRGRGRKGKFPIGVFKNYNNFGAKIRYRGVDIYLGTYLTIDQASDAVQKKRREIYG